MWDSAVHLKMIMANEIVRYSVQEENEMKQQVKSKQIGRNK